MTKSAIIVFVKNPELGKVKTRLAASIGDEDALEVYNQLLLRTREVLSGISHDKFIFYSNFIDHKDLWDQSQFNKRIQEGEGLGEKMLNAFKSVFDMGYERVCIIGSDCFDLNSSIIDEGINALDKEDFVIGPAMDGGYYLLGMNQLFPQVFQNKTYSTNSVCNEALTEIQKLGKTCFKLETLSDIDTVEDLYRVGLLKNS